MSKLKEFVDEVDALTGDSDLVTICREPAIAAAEFVKKRIDAAAKGGAATAGKPRKIRVRTKDAKKWREAKRKYRAKKAEEKV